MIGGGHDPVRRDIGGAGGAFSLRCEGTNGEEAWELPPETSEKVRKDNYERLFDEARRKVRAWEKANVRYPAARPRGLPPTSSGRNP